MTAWLLTILGAIAAAVAAWLKGRSRGRADAQAREDAAYRETRRRMDDVSTDDLDDASVIDRLRQHAGKPDRDL
ncbi:hypothetical protein PDE01_17030 [Paracoccus denitrificans]|nr:hypothetical protein PDE01_17030 [Paracoccus denitrificans]